MLIESDILIAHLKREDWLKPYAEKILKAIENGALQNTQTSTDVIHEIYNVFKDYTPDNIILGNLAKVATIPNITYIDPTREIILSAIELTNQHKITISDAIYAATTSLNFVPDHTILSTDSAYDKIPGIERIDPRQISLP